MYLPTFWKITVEANLNKWKHVAGYGLPISFLLVWIGYGSLYNWTYSCIIPPPSGVEKRTIL